MYDYKAKLVRVVDGDTVVLDLDLGFCEWRMANSKATQPSYRLARIDAPEMPTPEGIVAKEALVAMLFGKELVVHTEKTDHFARYLIELYADGVNVNDAMVAGGYAVSYRM